MEREVSMQPVIVPKIKVLSIANGIVQIKCINLDDYDYYEESYEFQLKYSCNLEWKFMIFPIEAFHRSSDVNCEDCIYFRVKINLQEYSFSVQMRSRDYVKCEWSQFCEPQIIIIPSSLMPRTFNIGDRVNFRDIDECWTKKGIIIDLLSDDIVKIKDKNQNKLLNVNISRVYGDCINFLYLLDISNNQLNVEKNILLRTNEENIVRIYEKLNSYFNDYLFDKHCHLFYKHKLKTTFISKFLSKNICDFLLPKHKEYKWKIKCLTDSNDGFMTLMNGRKSRLQCMTLGKRNNVKGMNLYQFHVIDEWEWFCDLCLMEIDDFQWQYQCNANIIDQHLICINCAYNIVYQYMQLNHLLNEILTHQLNVDCIVEIVNYVVGIVQKITT